MYKKPKWFQLREDLKNDILNGQIKPGDKMPSENILAKKYDLSRQTVRKAIEVLHNEGYVYAEHGRGTFCSDVVKNDSVSKNVAVVMTFLSDYIFPYVIKGIDTVLEKKDYSILLKSTNNTRKMEEKCLEELLKKNIDGLIIEPSKSQLSCKNSEMYSMFDRYRIPYVFIQGIYHGMEDKPYVLLDDCKGCYLVTKYLIDTNHKNIIGVFKADDMQGQERHRGYVKALQESGMNYDPDYVIWFHTEDSMTLPYDLIQEKISSQKVDAVVCYNDKIAIQVIKSIEESGKSVPDDISVTGFDNSMLSKNFKIPLTTIRHPQEKLGEKAAELLLKLMNGNLLDEKELHIIMEPELIIRSSVKIRKSDK